MGYLDSSENDDQGLFTKPMYVDESTRRRRLVPVMFLAMPMLLSFTAVLLTRGSMNHWAISGPRLADGQYELILLHMFAHGGVLHLAFNAMALFVFGPAVMERLGPLEPRTVTSFLLLFFLCGLAGLSLWLMTNPLNETPMLGASGAIFGLLGFVMRKPDPHGPATPLISREMVTTFMDWVKLHLPLVAVFIIPMIFGSGFFGLAWEAHLGGFIAGILLCGPILSWCDDGPDWIPDEQRSAEGD